MHLGSLKEIVCTETNWAHISQLFERRNSDFRIQISEIRSHATDIVVLLDRACFFSQTEVVLSCVIKYQTAVVNLLQLESTASVRFQQ